MQLPGQEPGDRALPDAWSRLALAIRGHRLRGMDPLTVGGVALAVEHEPALDLRAGRALQRMVLVAGHHHGVVPHHLHQEHLCATRNTTHRTYSLTNTL